MQHWLPEHGSPLNQLLPPPPPLQEGQYSKQAMEGQGSAVRSQWAPPASDSSPWTRHAPQWERWGGVGIPDSPPIPPNPLPLSHWAKFSSVPSAQIFVAAYTIVPSLGYVLQPRF